VPQQTSRRSRQAAATRREIVDAARRLFAARGFAATSVRDVAAEAGVSLQTIYDSVGSKRALVLALNDALDTAAGIPELAAAAMTSDDVDDVVRLGPRIACAIVERAGDILRVVLEASQHDAAVRQVRAEGNARHRAGARAVVDALRARGALPADRTDDDTVERLAVIVDAQVALMLHDDYDWPVTRIETWLTDLVRAHVLH
jgi:AcrR family transcriptional regulator